MAIQRHPSWKNVLGAGGAGDHVPVPTLSVTDGRLGHVASPPSLHPPPNCLSFSIKMVDNRTSLLDLPRRLNIGKNAQRLASDRPREGIRIPTK